MTAPISKARGGSPWLWLAVVCGTIHAGFSAAWALGSDVLLDTVGTVADRIASLGTAGRMGLLGFIAVGKLGVVILLVADAWGVPRSPSLRDLIRFAELVIGGGLLVYGAVSMLGSGAGLWMELGQPSPDPAAVTALWGHLGIWDLLFALWGLGTVVHIMQGKRDDALDGRATPRGHQSSGSSSPTGRRDPTVNGSGQHTNNGEERQ